MKHFDFRPDMPDEVSDFDIEYGPLKDEPEPEDAATSIINEVNGKVDDIDNQLSEVEQRLEKATYYRLLLNDSLFQDSRQAAQDVEQEIRAFVLHRLEVLMGIRAESRNKSISAQFTAEEAASLRALTVAEQQFSAEEAVALKSLAAKMLSNSRQITAPMPSPALKPVEAPVSARPELTKAKAAEPTLSIKPRLQSKPGPHGSNGNKSTATKKAHKSPDGVIIEGGKKYIEHQTTDADGKAAVLKMDITGQIVDPRVHVPMPTGGRLEQLTQRMASQVVDSSVNTGRGLTVTQTAIGLALKG